MASEIKENDGYGDLDPDDFDDDGVYYGYAPLPWEEKPYSSAQAAERARGIRKFYSRARIDSICLVEPAQSSILCFFDAAFEQTPSPLRLLS